LDLEQKPWLKRIYKVVEDLPKTEFWFAWRNN